MTISNWAIVIPYYNEEDCLRQCLDCIVRQKIRPQQVILVNNASQDRSESIAASFKEEYGSLFEINLLFERQKSKINALISGIKLVKTRYFATWDADTFYPDDYLQKAEKAFQSQTKNGEKIAAVMATDMYAPTKSPKGLWRMLKIQILSRIFCSECHAGGHSETFDTALFRKAGGFDMQRWPYVLEDHEIVQCLRKVGRIAYPWGLQCRPSRRRKNRKNVTWTKWEGRAYSYSPACLKDWIFYHFLGPRFAARGLFSNRLREQPWKQH